MHAVRSRNVTCAAMGDVLAGVEAAFACSEPSDGAYTRSTEAKISKIDLPEPLGFELDTAEF